MPAAEVPIDSEMVCALIRTQQPDLGSYPLEEVATGWDNVTFRLAVAMAVCLPRRQASVSRVRA